MGNTFFHLCDELLLTGNLDEDIPALLKHHQRGGLATHVAQVAERIVPIAFQAEIDVAVALQAAWLHDVGRLLPNAAMLEAAEESGIEVLPEERVHPGILHGKLSAEIAEQLFHISDPVVLNAIRCHTTLRANGTELDKALFVADKLAWHPDDSPFRPDLEKALSHSLDEAAWCFIDWLWHRPMPVMHPWLREARGELAMRRGMGE